MNKIWVVSTVNNMNLVMSAGDVVAKAKYETSVQLFARCFKQQM